MDDKIKGPVRASKHTPIYVLDADSKFLFPVYDRAERDKIIHKLNGYDVAVEALWKIYYEGDGWGMSLAWEALKELGELDGTDTSADTGAEDQDGGENSGVSLQAGGDGAVITGGEDGIGGRDQEEAGGIESGPGESDQVECAKSHCSNVLVDGDGPICGWCEKREDHGREMQAEIDNDPSRNYFKES